MKRVIKTPGSSSIKIIAYDDYTNTGYVTFISGGKYAYLNMPEKKFDEFVKADSKGKFFFREIKTNYTEVKQ